MQNTISSYVLVGKVDHNSVITTGSHLLTLGKITWESEQANNIPTARNVG
jgi:hypothetical protein